MNELLNSNTSPSPGETTRFTTLDPSQLPPMEAWNAELAMADEASMAALAEAKERKANASFGVEMGEAMDALDDAYRLRNLRELQTAWARSDVMVVPAEDVDPTALDKYFPPGNDLDSPFSLPATEAPPTDLEQAVKQLNTLPFVAQYEIHKPDERHYPRVFVKGMSFPLDRVVAVETFDSWAGRGSPNQFGGAHQDGKGKKGLEPAFAERGVEDTSRGAITAYAEQPVTAFGIQSQITVVRDAAGEYWGVSKGDGSHRLAAAKLRGQDAAVIGLVEFAADQDMPQIPFSVREKFAHA